MCLERNRTYSLLGRVALGSVVVYSCIKHTILNVIWGRTECHSVRYSEALDVCLNSKVTMIIHIGGGCVRTVGDSYRFRPLKVSFYNMHG